MSHESLQITWFILIAILWIGFFFLEGFDFGVGMLLPFLSKKDEERRVIINAIGPHWDGNEVWLITAGGATFAAFPQWYATLFSGFYPALFLLLIALIVRGVAFEFRSKDANPRWRKFWDWAIFSGSAIASLLLGVAFANLAKGGPIDDSMTYTGNLFTLLNPYGLLGGLVTIAVFLLHGAIFLTMKVEGVITTRITSFAKKFWIVAVAISGLMVIATYFYTDLVERYGIYIGMIPLAGVLAILLSGFLIYKGRTGWAFIMTSLAVILEVLTTFLIMFPRVMISSLGSDYSLTIYNASSSHYTLTVMTVVALVFMPIVLAYQAWTYWIFRKRITADPQTLVY